MKLSRCAASQSAFTQITTSKPITCQSADLSTSQLAALIGQSNPNDLIKSIPNSLSLTQIAQNPIFNQVKLFYNLIDIGFWASLILIIICTILLITIEWPELKIIFRALGWPLVIISAPILLTALTTIKSSDIISNLWINPQTVTGNIVQAVLPSLSQGIINSMINIPTSFFIVGLILVITSFFIPQTEAKVIPPGFNQ